MKVYKVNLVSGEKTLIQELQPGTTAGVVNISPVVMTRDGSRFAYSYYQVIVRALSDFRLALSQPDCSGLTFDCHPEQALFAQRGIWASRAKRSRSLRPHQSRAWLASLSNCATTGLTIPMNPKNPPPRNGRKST